MKRYILLNDSYLSRVTSEMFGSASFSEILKERFPDLREIVMKKIRSVLSEDIPHTQWHWVDDRIGVYADEIISLLTKEDEK